MYEFTEFCAKKSANLIDGRWRHDKVPAAQPRPRDFINDDDDERPTHWRNIGDTHTEGSNGIYGPTREACCRPHSPEACWVREGVSHPPPGTECRCVRIAVSASVYLLM